MPAEWIHLTALRESVAAARFPADARRCVTRHEDAARLGAVALDLPYFDRYLEEVVRYVLGRSPRGSPWGAIVHERAAVGIAVAVLERARERGSDGLRAMGLGLVSHASMDRQLHPLVNALARRHAGRLTHDASHREVEKFQSICFHEVYFGRDLLGHAGITRHLGVPVRELFASGDVLTALCAAYSSACAEPMAPRALAAMGSGYERHAALLGSRLGRTVASEADKAAARPRFLFGAWGTFEQALAGAIDGALPALERAWALATASSADAGAARAALLELLPLGSIDPPGHDVDLDVPLP
jgi:hypothetical protein